MVRDKRLKDRKTNRQLDTDRRQTSWQTRTERREYQADIERGRYRRKKEISEQDRCRNSGRETSRQTDKHIDRNADNQID